MLRDLLRKQTLASFDYQWRELPESDALLSDEWFRSNVTRIIADELLCLKPEWFRGKRIVDAGCGTGRWTVGLLELGADVTAVDFSEHALEQVRQHVAEHCTEEQQARLQTQQADLLDLPDGLAEERFDCVFSFGVLHHTGDTHAALRSVARLAGEDGVIFLYLYGRESVTRLSQWRLGAERLLLAPLPFDLKQRAIHVLRPGSEVHHAFDLLSPTINDRHTYADVRDWLVESGFPDVRRTIEHTELFVRGARRPEAIAPFTLPPPSPPYWFERYSAPQSER